MKSLLNDSRNAIQFVATLAIAMSGAAVMTQQTTPFNQPAPLVSRAQFEAEIVIAQDECSLVSRAFGHLFRAM
jgi:hypothetical protein